jgi:diacylglycerol kinase (ATP)
MRNRLVISNKKSGKSSSFESKLEELGRDESTQVLRLTRDVNLNEAVQRAVVGDKCSLVIAAGGDGTVNLVVNAIMCLPEELRPRLAIIPIGTANDFAGTLLISDDLQQVVSSIDDGEFVPIDVVRIRVGRFERYFANVAAGGNSVEVSESMTDDMKAMWGPLCYLRGAVGVLGAMKTFRIQAKVDDELLEVESWGVLVANGRTNAGRIVIAPLASPTDGLLDVIIIKNGDFLDMIEIASRTLFSSLLECQQVVFRQGMKLQLQSTPSMRFTLDGEVIDEVPIEFEIVPGAIDMLVGARFRNEYPI